MIMDKRRETHSKEEWHLGTPAATIDEVIVRLDQIIDYCSAHDSPAAYFAVLYKKVTSSVRDRIAQNGFEDGARMERLDVRFANRYLAAFDEWMAGKSMTGSWTVAFQSVSKRRCIVLQHLLIGMNAHINLDLGVATCEVMEGVMLEDIHPDFNAINSVLAAMTGNIKACLTKINPLMKLLDVDIFNVDDMLVNFSIDVARDGAWDFAQQLAALQRGAAEQACLQSRDLRIQGLGGNIEHPLGMALRFVVWVIRLFERRKVRKIIAFLGQ
jgi:hypothetical protein